MRRALAALFVAFVTIAAIGPLPFGNSCCCKSSCPMKRATQMHCNGKSCDMSSSVIAVTIADAILARPLPQIEPRAQEIAFVSVVDQGISGDRTPDPPPPRA